MGLTRGVTLHACRAQQSTEHLLAPLLQVVDDITGLWLVLGDCQHSLHLKGEQALLHMACMQPSTFSTFQLRCACWPAAISAAYHRPGGTASFYPAVALMCCDVAATCLAAAATITQSLCFTQHLCVTRAFCFAWQVRTRRTPSSAWPLWSHRCVAACKSERPAGTSATPPAAMMCSHI